MRARPDVAEDHVGGGAQAAEGVQRVAVVCREEGTRGCRLPQAAAGEHLRDRVRDPELRAQPVRLREGVGGDLETRVHCANVRAEEDGIVPASTLRARSGSPITLNWR